MESGILLDRHISGSIFDMLQHILVGAVTWDFLCGLLKELLNAQEDRVQHTILLQELSNVANLKFQRVQRQFKHQVASTVGKMYFKQILGVFDNGIARLSMKKLPESLTISDPQLNCILRFCQGETQHRKPKSGSRSWTTCSIATQRSRIDC